MSAIFMLFDVIGPLPIVTYYWRRSTTNDKSPSDLVSTLSATTVNGLGIPTAFRLRDDDTEVISRPRTGPGKVYRLGHTTRHRLERLPNINAETSPEIAQCSLNCSEPSETNK
jgi:hypothetical protein